MNNKGVSAIISVILMVAVLIATIATIYVYVSGLLYQKSIEDEIYDPDFTMLYGIIERIEKTNDGSYIEIMGNQKAYIIDSPDTLADNYKFLKLFINYHVCMIGETVNNDNGIIIMNILHFDVSC